MNLFALKMRKGQKDLLSNYDITDANFVILQKLWSPLITIKAVKIVLYFLSERRSIVIDSER